MTVPSPSRHELAVLALARPASPADAAAAVRLIKNAIIGNPTKKRLYLDALNAAPVIAVALRSYATDSQLVTELATVIASLAHGSDKNAETLITAGIVPPLLDALASPDPRLVDASLRALRTFSQRSITACAVVFQPAHICTLISLLAEPAQTATPESLALTVHIAEVAASILARLAECNTDFCNTITTNAGATQLLKWIDSKWSAHPKTQEAVLDAIASLCKGNPRIAKSVALTTLPCGQRVVTALLAFVRDKRPSMRLVASACITHLHRTASIPRDQQGQVVILVMPALIRLFQDISPLGSALTTAPATVSERAMSVFALLVSDSVDLQLAVTESDAIIKLVNILTALGSAANTGESGNKNGLSLTGIASTSGASKPDKKSRNAASAGATAKPADVFGSQLSHAAMDRHRENALIAIASACSLREECRKQAIDAKLLPCVVSLLSSRTASVRAAACQCARSLSRSVKILRTSLMDANIATPLFDLLRDDSIQVQIEASATLCNLVLDFSPMKKVVLERGADGRFVELVDSTDPALRLNAIWTLKNIVFQADSETKSHIIGQLGWNRLIRLFEDSEIPVQTQALNFIRNFACGKESDVDAVFKGFDQTDILNILETKLQTMHNHTQIVLQALYIIVNLSIGTIEHKNFIMAHNSLLRRALKFLCHDDPQVRVAAIWCSINLTWPDEPGAQERISVLRGFDIEPVLQRLADHDEDLDVKDRAGTALANIRGPVCTDDMSMSVESPVATSTFSGTSAAPTTTTTAVILLGSNSGNSNGTDIAVNHAPAAPQPAGLIGPGRIIHAMYAPPQQQSMQTQTTTSQTQQVQTQTQSSQSSQERLSTRSRSAGSTI